MLRSVIFDFNGVVIDDEELHFRAFARLFEEQGLSLTHDEYFTRYLGLDDKGCVAAVIADKTEEAPTTDNKMKLVERKGEIYLEELEGKMRLFPGVVDLVRRLSAKLFLAIASGARKHEIELVIEKAGVQDCFFAVVSADEVSSGKPDPEGYLKAFERLRGRRPEASDLETSECLVIEDAPNGIKAAHAAGMACVAVTNSCKREALEQAGADLIFESLEDVSLEDLKSVVQRRSPQDAGTTKTRS